MTELARRCEGADGADRERRQCMNCPNPVNGHVKLCWQCHDDLDADYDETDRECGNCGGEGFTYGCSWDWQCDTYDEGEGTCLCERPCEWCAAALRARKDRGDGE